MRFKTLSMTLAIVLAAAAAGSAFAEVRARTDRNGYYQATQVVGARWKPIQRVWSLVARSSGTNALNVEGDRNGDLWPAIRESSVAPHHPWVVWSRFNGDGYDLAWSRWHGGWQPVTWLAGRSAGDDLDPDVAFNGAGRPFVVWWRTGRKGGSVYVSTYETAFGSVDRAPSRDGARRGRLASVARGAAGRPPGRDLRDARGSRAADRPVHRSGDDHRRHRSRGRGSVTDDRHVEPEAVP